MSMQLLLTRRFSLYCSSAVCTNTEQKVFMWKVTLSTNSLVSQIFTGVHHTYKHIFQQLYSNMIPGRSTVHTQKYRYSILNYNCMSVRPAAPNRGSDVKIGPLHSPGGQLVAVKSLYLLPWSTSGKRKLEVSGKKNSNWSVAEEENRLDSQYCCDGGSGRGEVTVNCPCRRCLEKVGKEIN